VVPVADCNAAAPLNCDTAVYQGVRANFTITSLGGGLFNVTDNVGTAGIVAVTEGSDTLRNIERIRFADATVLLPSAGGSVTVAVPNVVNLPQAAAISVLTGADFTTTSTLANSPTIAIGNVINTTPLAGTQRPFGSNVNLIVAVGALVPNVVGGTQAAATTALTAAGLTVGTVTQTNSATAAGLILSQAPSAGSNEAPGTAVALTVSLGPALRTVPNVVNLTQSAATTAIQNAGLTVGAVTNQTHPTIIAGNVISTTPAAGGTLPPLSAVALVVSSGAPQPAGLVVALGFDEAAGLTAINTVNSALNGTIRQALRVPGRFGGALQFDGVNDWVTITDSALATSPLKLGNAMTLEAWVNPSNMSGWETVLMKERGTAGEGLLSYALYAHDGAPLSSGTPRPAGYVRVTPTLTTSDRAVRGGTTLPLDTWTHIAVTYNAATSQMIFYLNGVAQTPITAGAGTIAETNGALRIGGNNSSTGEFFQGLIDEVRVYNRALSQTEIQTDMNAAIVR
jgi:beta-lactam-binding protein with PASTA domain